MTLDPTSPLDSIYPPDVLAKRQALYPNFFNGIYNAMILPRLDAQEQRALAEVRFSFPQSLPGQEPIGFCCADKTITLSVASLKFLNDLLLAYCWLGRHGYSLATIDDYLLMLSVWQSPVKPPEPLAILGIPADAADEAGTGDLHVDWVKRAYVFILLHELGHLRYGDSSTDDISPTQSQAEESRADQFALNVMARLGLVVAGITQFFEWSWAFMPNPVDFPSEQEFWNAVREETHPLSTQRLLQVAADIDANAPRYAVDQSPQTLASFRELSLALRKLASLKSNTTMLREAALRAGMLLPEDLAPRRRDEMIAMPLGANPGRGPFHGKLAGPATFANVAADIEVTLQESSGHVTGAFANRVEIGRIDGMVDADELNFRWTLGEMRGCGRLRFDGESYEGTLGLGDSTAGGVTWKLRRAQVPA